MNGLPDVLPEGIESPPATFNFAQHLLDANAGRADKAAFVDDAGAVAFGRLAERVRRLAAGLRALGIRREERVLLLMQDTTDWPVAFLGAIHAGIVPVAVNTLLTADDYAYMLEHSRAQAALVSGALLPALKAALVKSDHEVQKVIVSRPVAPVDFGEVEFEHLLGQHAPSAGPAATGAVAGSTNTACASAVGGFAQSWPGDRSNGSMVYGSAIPSARSWCGTPCPNSRWPLPITPTTSGAADARARRASSSAIARSQVSCASRKRMKRASASGGRAAPGARGGRCISKVSRSCAT